MSECIPLADLIASLRDTYGAPPRPKVTEPFAMVVLENVAYLVDDEVRGRVFDRLKKEFGVKPDALLAAPDAAMAAVIDDGGMKPPMRVEKVKRAAAIALEVGLAKLRKLVREDPAAAKRVLKRFPGFGDPGAERVLLFNGSWRGLAPDSNALRVLTRVGFGDDTGSYAHTYRSVGDAVSTQLPDDPQWNVTAHQLLRTHGREMCKTSAPLCSACPVSERCPSAG